MKTVWGACALGGVLFAICIWAYSTWAYDKPIWLLAIGLVVFLPAFRMLLGRSLVTLRLHDDHVTLESGFLSRTRRTVDMAKIQDVTVRQTLAQRFMRCGDLILESAGESGTMAILNVDDPRGIADLILARSKRAR